MAGGLFAALFKRRGWPDETGLYRALPAAPFWVKKPFISHGDVSW